MISGGEKQRLAVARLILKDPPLLFFDEATSALDTQTEGALLQNINSILKEKKRTSVFVAHRLRTVYDADLIIVLSEGRVAESGTHQQLINRGGMYSELWAGKWSFDLFPRTAVDDTLQHRKRCSSITETVRRRGVQQIGRSGRRSQKTALRRLYC